MIAIKKFLRKAKKVFVSFVPKDLIQRIMKTVNLASLESRQLLNV